MKLSKSENIETYSGTYSTDQTTNGISCNDADHKRDLFWNWGALHFKWNWKNVKLAETKRNCCLDYKGVPKYWKQLSGTERISIGVKK